jgi:uncharacterized protein (TIGR03435 family)
VRGTSVLVSPIGFFLFAANAGYGQSAQPELAFEVASVRPSTQKVNLPPIFASLPGAGANVHGGPGTDDPERIVYSGVPLTMILVRAFGMGAREISGPEWLETQKYDIEAKILPGTTPEQFQTMLQNLLKERFGLVVHRETKDAADVAYDLVLAKGGPKLKTTAEPVGPPKATQAREGAG